MLSPSQTHKLQQHPVSIYRPICLLLLAAAAAAASYYVIQDHRATQKRKQIKAQEREALRLLHQIKQDHLAVAHTLDTLRSDDPKREYKLAHSNELLLRLMERLDAIQPRMAILLDPKQPEEESAISAHEKQAIEHIKKRKRHLIKAIEGDFQRIDVCLDRLS